LPGGQVGEGVSLSLDAGCILNRIFCSSNRTLGTQPADALGVKRELEKALALNGKPTK
jgi:hypothetical protein